MSLRKKKYLFITSISSLLLLLAGCLSITKFPFPIPLAAHQAELAAKSFRLPHDKAQLYLFRCDGHTTPIATQLRLDGRVVAYLQGCQFTTLSIEEGKHELVSRTEHCNNVPYRYGFNAAPSSEQTLTLFFKRGETYFIRNEWVPHGLLRGEYSLSVVPEQVGRSEIAKPNCRLVQNVE